MGSGLLEEDMVVTPSLVRAKKPVSPCGQMGFLVSRIRKGACACFLLRSLKD